MTRSLRMWMGLLFCASLALNATAATEADRLIQQLKPQGFVSDFANVIGTGPQQQLETVLENLSRKTGAQIAVVTLPTLYDGQIDDFANRLFEAWGIGERGKDNGVLLLAAMEQRRARIEVGYGLEGVLTDARAGRILDAYLIPAFKAKRFESGLVSGALVIAEHVARDAGVTLEAGTLRAERRATGRSERGFSLLHLLFLLIMIPVIIRHPWLLLFLLNSGGGRGGYHGGGGFGGGFGGFGGGLSGGGGASRGW